MIFFETVSKEGRKSFSPKVTSFPDKTMLIRVPEINSDAEEICISWKYENEAELLNLMYLSGNLKDRYPRIPMSLYMPYLPNARMDRVHSADEVFTLKYFCNAVNSMGFDKITVLDAHSNVGTALLDRCENLSPDRYIGMMLDDCGYDSDKDFIFFPDEGSCKRYSELPSVKNCKNIGFGIKKRDWATGRIDGLDIFGASPEGKRVFIIDDICAYGGTVYHSALKLKETGCTDINVFFTHCENSIAQGKLFDEGLLKGIYTTDSICTLDTEEYPLLHKFDCKL